MNNQLIKDYIDGALLEWTASEKPQDWYPLRPYLLPKDLIVFSRGIYTFRKKPEGDPYKIFKDALKEGKYVEVFMYGKWIIGSKNITDWGFSEPPESYRIKPEQKTIRTHLRINTISPALIVTEPPRSKAPNVELTFEDNILAKVEMI